MTHSFHLYYDGIEVAEPPITETELQQYRRDSKHSLASYNSRRNNTMIRAVKEHLKQHGYDYAIGLLAITVVFAFLVYALPAMAAPMTCSLDYHTGIKLCQ